MGEAPRIFSEEYYARMRLLESASWWNAGMRDIAAALFRRARLGTSGLLVDVGCGSGQTMAWFLDEHPGWAAAGADLAVEGVTAARAFGLPVAVGNAMELPFQSASADVVITLDVLQHLPLSGGDVAAIAEMSRVLRPGGLFFVRTNAQSIPRATEDPANNFRKYEPRVLESKLKEAGLEILTLSRANGLLGLAEVARELRATRREGSGYHGILAVPGASRGLAYSAKRAILRAEAGLIAAGIRLPLGRSIVALCRKPGTA
ncbi:MAG TPA: class I SAM-dependent methyltransferase [Gemmatimonadaceae bacterium]|nr:class I SAM-dependent methyltransferase [Gemmatimonadaceae bacterium]